MSANFCILGTTRTALAVTAATVGMATATSALALDFSSLPTDQRVLRTRTNSQSRLKLRTLKRICHRSAPVRAESGRPWSVRRCRSTCTSEPSWCRTAPGQSLEPLRGTTDTRRIHG